MDESRLPDGFSAEELGQRLGERLTDGEMESVVGGSMEFIQLLSNIVSPD